MILRHRPSLACLTVNSRARQIRQLRSSSEWRPSRPIATSFFCQLLENFRSSWRPTSQQSNIQSEQLSGTKVRLEWTVPIMSLSAAVLQSLDLEIP